MDSRSSRVKHTLLDAGTVCFLCLDNVFLNDNNYPVTFNEPQQFKRSNIQLSSLRTICHYLQMDKATSGFCKTVFMGKWFHLNRHRVEEDDTLKKFSKFPMTFCQECSSVVLSLSELCLELELLQMKVNYFLESFYGLLKKSETDQEKVCTLQGHLDAETGTSRVGSHLGMLREEIRKKSNIKLKSMVPKVLIHKNVEVENKINQHPLLDSLVQKREENRNPILLKFKGITTTATPSCEIKHSPPPANQPAPIDIEAPLKKNNGTTSVRASSTSPRSSNKRDTMIYKCTLCRPHCDVQNRHLSRHKARHHVETLFASCKTPVLSTNEFKLYCNHVLLVEVLTCKKPKGNDGKPSRKCPHCSNCFSNHYSMRAHIVARHKDIIAKKLVELQQSTTLKDLKAIDLPAASALDWTERWKCETCDKSFAFKSGMLAHKKNRCNKSGRRQRKKQRLDHCTKFRNRNTIKQFHSTSSFKNDKNLNGIHGIVKIEKDVQVDELEPMMCRNDVESDKFTHESLVSDSGNTFHCEVTVGEIKVERVQVSSYDDEY